MKAIFIQHIGTPDLLNINRDLKDCKDIVNRIPTENGTILIVDNVTREEKLKKIDNYAKTIDNNSI
jgi:hypothetical protein